ncbi:MFS transporter [Thermomonospora catenispora]|uniref:MFS transporter n=1 Tax=Thermomonospora catenispora TaxID=2493090 RepID=UPI00111E3722|nr:MFS transporter [Thermomonospora catenispora]TNY37978.1 MFS transporter [Thermomonospora catenispora]
MTTVQRAAGPPQTADPRRWAALAIVLLGVFMDLVDITIVLVAAPAIQTDLGAGHSSIQWVVAAYALGLGLLLITGGRLGDLFGRKRMFLTGVAGFTAASMACGLAQGIGMLIAARAVQGAAAAMMVPQALATIQVAFSVEERPKAFGIYGAVNGVAAAAAPIIGGLLVGDDPTAWRWVFWVNVPIGVIAFIGAAALMRESRAERRPRLDVLGVLIVTLGLLLALYPLVQGSELGWPWWGWAMMAGSLPVLAVFAYTQARRERAGGMPLVPTSLFRLRSFVAGLVIIVAVFSSISALFLVLTWQLQQGHHFTALRTGLTFLAWPVGLAATSGMAVQHAAKAGRRLVAIGTVLLVLSMSTLVATIGLADDLTSWHLVPGLLLGGIGFGMVAPILVHIGLSGVPEENAGAASGVANTVVQVSGAAGIAVVGSLFTTFLDHGTDRAAQLSLGFVAVAFLVGLVLCRALPKTARSMS